MSRIFLLILTVALIAASMFFLHGFNKLRITAEFEDLEPINQNISVYFKGFRLGYVTRVYPAKNFTRTNVDMILSAKDMRFPENITAKVKVKNKHEYMELIYPQEPSKNYLKQRAVIKGIKTTTWNNFLSDNAESGDMEEIRENLNTTLLNAGDMFLAITDLVTTGNEILKDVRPALKASSKNLETTTKNFAQAAIELNEATKNGRLKRTFKNLENSTYNLETISTNFGDISSISKNETIKRFNCMIYNANNAILNLNDIILGFKATLSKRFATFRIIFGKPIS